MQAVHTKYYVEENKRDYDLLVQAAWHINHTEVCLEGNLVSWVFVPDIIPWRDQSHYPIPVSIDL